LKFVRQNYYEILDVDPKASDEEVKRAYRMLRGSFEPQSMAIYSLYSPEESEAIGAKIDEVFRVLTNRDRRRAYDRYLELVSGDVAIEEQPEAFFEQVHDIEELTALDELEPSSEDLEVLRDHSVSAVVQVEASQSDLFDGADAPTPEGIDKGGLEPFEEWPETGEIDASTEELGELPAEIAEVIGEQLALPTRPVAATDDGARTAPDPATMPVPIETDDESLEYEVDSGDGEELSEPSLFARPRMRSWTREFASARLAEARSLELTPLSDDTLAQAESSDDVTGALLRALRERRGVDLHTIAERTKISLMTLQFIEEDRYDALPAAIYLRGFLEQYTKMLDLPRSLVDRYMTRLGDRP